MATNVARIQAELDLDSGKFHGSITSAIGAVKKFNVAVNDSNKSIQNIERRITGLGASLRDTMVVLGQFRAAMHTLWMFTGQWAAAVIDANAKLERLQQLMKGLSKGTTEVERMTDALRDMNYVLDKAKNAPFTVDALADSFVKLKAAGIDPTKGAMDALTDAVARFGGSSEQLHRATIAIQQMSGKGVISMEELRQQLGEAVPNAMQLMARGLGMSMQEMVKQISLGRVEAKTALERLFIEMRAEFGGASKDMMNTWTGLMQRLKTEWMLFARELGNGGMFDAAKKTVGELIAFMGSADGKRFGRELGQSLGEAAKAAGQLVKWLVENRNEIITWAKLLAQMFAVKMLYSFATGLISTAAQVVMFTQRMMAMNTAMITTRISTMGWTAALGAAAGPIGIAITAIAGLIFWLDAQKDAAIRAGEAINWYYQQTALGQAVSPQEYKAAQTRVQFLKDLKVAAEEADKATGSGNQYARTRTEMRLDAMLKQGRELGFIQDDAVEAWGRTRGSKIKLALNAVSANLTSELQALQKQAGLQLDASMRASTEKLGRSLDTMFGDVDKKARRKLADIQARYDSGTINKDEYQRERAAALGGAADSKKAGLIAARDDLMHRAGIAKLNSRNDELNGLIMQIDLINQKLEQVNGERELLLSAPKLMAGGGGKDKGGGKGPDTAGDDPLMNLIQQLKAKQADLNAQLDGGMPKLEKFKALVAAGEFGKNPNAGMIGAVEALYTSIEKLEDKVAMSKATEELKQNLTDMEARAKADVISASVEASGDVYSQVASGMVGFNRQIKVMEANLSKTNMTREQFAEWVERIKGHIAEVDFINFQKFVRDTEWENYLATLPEKARNLAELNRQLDEFEKLRAQLKKDNPEKAEEIDDGVDGMINSARARYQKENQGGLRDWIDQWKDTTQEMDNWWGSTMDNMANTLTDFIMTGEASWADFANAAIRELTRILVSKALAQLAEWVVSLFSWNGGGGFGYANGSAFSRGTDIMPQALGGAWLNGVKFFAKGGVVNQPTMFGMSGGGLGVMGEAGPEAILPLQRDPNGKLGVKMMGETGAGGTQITNSVQIAVTVNADGQASSDTNTTGKEARELGKMLDAKVKQGIAEEMQQGGSIWRMMNGR